MLFVLCAVGMCTCVVVFTGELVGAHGFQGRSVFAKWRLMTVGDAWRIMKGEASGRTWIADSDLVSSGALACHGESDAI